MSFNPRELITKKALEKFIIDEFMRTGNQTTPVKKPKPPSSEDA